jgi:hypothetical protein
LPRGVPSVFDARCLRRHCVLNATARGLPGLV